MINKELIKKITDKSNCFGTVFLHQGEYGFIFYKPNQNSYFFFLLDPNLKSQMSLTNAMEYVIVAVANSLVSAGHLKISKEVSLSHLIEKGVWISKDSNHEFDRLSLSYEKIPMNIKIKQNPQILSNVKLSTPEHMDLTSIKSSAWSVKINSFEPFNFSERYLELIELLG